VRARSAEFLDLSRWLIIQIRDRRTREKILAAAKSELLKHSLDTFKDDILPPVIMTGRPSCRKQIGTINQLMQHLADDVLPVILRTAFKTEST
jgi:hypothetical protein